MSSQTAFGIDLGTTFSVVAHLDHDGRPWTIQNSEGEVKTPSVVFFDESSVIVGREALKAAEFEPERVARFVKREMGRTLSQGKYAGRQFPPEVIQALILKKLRDDAELKLGTVNKVVITVPAYFDEPRRKATQDAGRIAGLDVLDIINEPTAAAIAYGVQHQFLDAGGESRHKETILVYDLGGGTFDATLMEIDGSHYHTLATGGDVYLGGVDWDKRLVDYLAEQFQKEHGVDPREDAGSYQRLLLEAEQAKHALTARAETTVLLAFNGDRSRIAVSRSQFEELNADLLDRTHFTVKKVLREGGKSWSDVTRLLLVGGSSRMPAVQEMLERESGMTADRSLSPDEAVAHGAAVYAGLLMRHSADIIRDVSVKNVNSHDLGVVGIETASGRKRRRIMIPRNTSLPAIKQSRFQTHVDGQPSVLVNVVEGGDASGNNATVIGRCVVRDLPPNLPAGTAVNVKFAYAENGRLTVTAALPETDVAATVTIERESGLTENDIAYWGDQLQSGKFLKTLAAAVEATAEATPVKPPALKPEPETPEKPLVAVPPAMPAPEDAPPKETPAKPAKPTPPKREPVASQPAEKSPANGKAAAPEKPTSKPEQTEPVAKQTTEKPQRTPAASPEKTADPQPEPAAHAKRNGDQPPTEKQPASKNGQTVAEKSPTPKNRFLTPETPVPSAKPAVESKPNGRQKSAPPVTNGSDKPAEPDTKPEAEPVAATSEPPATKAEPPKLDTDKKAESPAPPLPAAAADDSDAGTPEEAGFPTMEEPTGTPAATPPQLSGQEKASVATAATVMLEPPELPAKTDQPALDETIRDLSAEDETLRDISDLDAEPVAAAKPKAAPPPVKEPPSADPKAEDEPKATPLPAGDEEEEDHSHRTLIQAVASFGMAALIQTGTLMVLAFLFLPTPFSDPPIGIFSSLPEPKEEKPPELVKVEKQEEFEDPQEKLQIKSKIKVKKDNAFVNFSPVKPPSIAFEPNTKGNAPTAIAPNNSEFGGRSAGSREALLTKYGGTKASEGAVYQGLKWLERHQREDGSWAWDHTHAPGCDCKNPGTMKKTTMAATAFGALAFLGHGDTYSKGDFQPVVERALIYLLAHEGRGVNGLNGDFRGDYEGNSGMYTQGIVTIVLAEALAMNELERAEEDEALRNQSLKKLSASRRKKLRVSKTRRLNVTRQLEYALKRAVMFILNAQGSDGGWRYSPRSSRGDTSVVGWQVMALASAYSTKRLRIPDRNILGANAFLDSVQSQSGARYGYTNPQSASPTRTAIGLLCRIYLGWKRSHTGMRDGVKYISQTGPSRNDMYYNYYATQVMHQYGGELWKKWNPVMRDQLVNTQIKTGHAAGSWNPTGGGHGARAGRHFDTCLSIMTLEVYYRHLPLYQHRDLDAGSSGITEKAKKKPDDKKTPESKKKKATPGKKKPKAKNRKAKAKAAKKKKS